MIGYIFNYLVFFYSMAIMASYVWLVIQSYRAQNRLAAETPDDETMKYMLKGSPLVPTVSIIAPAYNEETNIIVNVESLLKINYPNFEVIIVNDGSKDRTLELLKDRFDLDVVPSNIVYRVPCSPIKNVYKSRNSKYSNLTVVDKVNGGRKANSSNAGINVCQTKYFICTDADCIIEPMALYRMMWPVINSHKPMIGVSGTMLMSNDCDIPEIQDRVAKTKSEKKSNSLFDIPFYPNILPMFQQLEYLRSFLIGKLGWSSINSLPNISGGFGLFDTEVAIKSGGYDKTSMAEDMDMLLRMVTYMKNHHLDFCLAQVPKVCCWTKGPETMKGLFNQRKRWARGLFEIVVNHFEMFFNWRYGTIGLVTLPYIFVFEFLACVIEFVGMLWLLWLIPNDAVNWNTFGVILGMVYVFSVMMTFFLMYFDYRSKAVKWRYRFWRYIKFFVCSVFEPVYHLYITCTNVWGYVLYIFNKGKEWKTIER